MSATSTITAEREAAAPAVTAEMFLERLWGIRPGHNSPRFTPEAPAIAFETLGEGVADWLYRMWGIRPGRCNERAA